jgi:hypothetical protein
MPKKDEIDLRQTLGEQRKESVMPEKVEPRAGDADQNADE